MMQILPKCDSRHWSFHKHYGSVILPKEYNADRVGINSIQPPGDVRCVLFTICDILKDKDKVEYDMNDLERRILMAKDGTDPVRAVKEVIKNGILPKGGTERVFPFTSFFTAHTGLYDAFDNTRTSILMSEYPIMAYGPWFANWKGGFEKQGAEFVGYHCTDNDGWILRNEGEYISCEAWTGEKHYFSREVFNGWASRWGFNTIVLSTKEVEEKRNKTTMEMIIDLCQNVIIKMRQLLILRSAGRIPSFYDVSKSLLGLHLTLDNSVPKQLGCGEALSFVLKRYGMKIPYGGIAGTAELKKWLDLNALRLDAPEQGCVIISPTEGDRHGHCGTVARYDYVYNGDFGIISNDSNTGLWGVNWSLEEWYSYYGGHQKLKTYFYKV